MPDSPASNRPSDHKFTVSVVVAVCLLVAAVLMPWYLWPGNWLSPEQEAIQTLISDDDEMGGVIYGWERIEPVDEQTAPGNFVMKALYGENYASHAVIVRTWEQSAETLAASLVHLPKLERLELHDCELNVEVAKALLSRPELKHIFFAGNPPSPEVLEVFSKGKQIEELLFAGVPITDAQLESIGKLPNLKEVYLAESNGTDEGLAKLAQAHSLESLTIYKMPQITDDGVSHLKNLTQLKYLTLPNSQMTAKSLTIVPHMPQLITLQMSCLPSDDDTTIPTEKIWPNLPELIDLQLDASCIDDEDLAAIAKLPNIKILTLFNPNITDNGVAQLAQARKLLTLDLRGTHISDAGLKPLAQLPQLIVIDITTDRNIQLETVGEADVDYEPFDPNGPRPRFESPHDGW